MSQLFVAKHFDKKLRVNNEKKQWKMLWSVIPKNHTIDTMESYNL